MTDPRADPSPFDPRFDRAFQPGYDPRNDPATAARSTPRRFDAAPPTQLTPPASVLPAELSAPSRSVPPADPPPAASESEEPTVDDLFAESEPADDAATGRGVNPFMITLWVASVVLVAAGITVFRSIPGLEQQGSFSTGSRTIASYSQILSLSVLGPILIGSGVLVAAGNIFLLAAGWPSSRGRPGQ